MSKCQCRWNCSHGSCYDDAKGNLNCEGKCHGITAGNFVRYTCDRCGHFRIFEVCDACWNHLQMYWRHNASCSCENCRAGSHVREVWSLYQDKAGV